MRQYCIKCKYYIEEINDEGTVTEICSERGIKIKRELSKERNNCVLYCNKERKRTAYNPAHNVFTLEEFYKTFSKDGDDLNNKNDLMRGQGVE